MKCNKSDSILHKLTNGFTLEKRFESEFEKTEKIGTGGFSSVYKVRNILDNSFYAIKKIKIKVDKKSTDLQKNISSVLQEIRYLAVLKSEYIVNYNHSWVEVNLKPIKLNKISRRLNFEEFDDESNEDDEEEFDDKIVMFEMKNSLNRKFNLNQENSEDCFQYKPSDSYNKQEIYGSKNDKKIMENNQKKEIKKTFQEVLKIGNKTFKYDEIDSLSIYIQMELCKDTLADFIEARNKKILAKSKKNQNIEEILYGIDLDYCLNIFDKILQGVEFIHNRENLIHRDIKPKNIFFSFDNQIKIGDLGLATNSLNNKCEMICPSPTLDRSMNKDDEGYLDAYNDSKDDLALDSSFRLEIEEETVKSFPVNHQKVENHKEFKFIREEIETHTKNIGTSQYAAPEQLKNNHYNNKVDIYPLGIILLELIYPFKTRMEKHETLEILKNKHMLPKVISEMFPRISELILMMTDTDYERRPNVGKCRTLFKNILNELKRIKDKKLNTIEKRKRFLSEDIQGVKSFEFQYKLAENDEWKACWVKLYNDKLLIFFKQNAIKANLIYDLKECEIKGNYIRENMEQNFNRISKLKKIYNSFIKLLGKQKDLDDVASYQQRRYSFATIKCIENNEEKDDIIHPKEHLNLVIEIQHHYQQKLMIKGVYIFEAIEFYKILKHNMKNYV